MRKKKNKLTIKISSIIVFVAGLILSIVFTTMFRLVRIEGDSMYPTLQHGCRIIVRQRGFELAANDIVVLQTEDGFAIKRVIALPNDSVTLKDNEVIVNGIRISPYAYYGEEPVSFELTDTQYFVIGDNYQISYDSRDYGPISIDQIIGKYLFTLAP